MTTVKLSRRRAIGAAAAVPLAGGLATAAQAAAEMMGPTIPRAQRIRLARSR